MSQEPKGTFVNPLYTPIECKLFPKLNKMCLMRGEEWLGIVICNDDPIAKLKSFNEGDVIVNLQKSNCHLNFQELKDIEAKWNEMQQIRATLK